MFKILCTGLLTCFVSMLQAADTAQLIKTVKSVGPNGTGQAAAVAAIKELQQLPATEIPTLLASLNDANPLAANWLRGAIEASFAKAKDATALQADLEKFLLNTKQSPTARRLSYELLARLNKAAAEKLISQMQDDPALELRREAIDFELKLLNKTMLADAGKLNVLQKLLTRTRDLDQIESFAKTIRELKGEVDLPKHMGFVMDWKLIGPFDNRDKKGFPVPYPPETEIKLDATYAGMSGPVKWIEHTSSDQYGMVDLNTALGKHKGAVAYALADFTVDTETPCELRLGCITANKIWLNGELLFEREVYHALTKIDQYIARGVLKPGRNTILLKVCQNEQTENWAQEWEFQLRVCDSIGTAILAKDRKPTPAPALLPPPEKKK